MIRVLIVDDEPLARRGIRARLVRSADVTVVGECGNGRDAVEAIRNLAPDLVFLDVQMPGLDGFDVVDTVGIERMPSMILVTAYDQHALRAFEARALDYLLKPIDDDRFDDAIGRARARIAERRDSAVGRRVAAALTELGVGLAATTSTGAVDVTPPDRLLVRSGGRVLLIPVDEIDWIEAAGDYVKLHVGRAAHLRRETMGALEKRLDRRRFARIHRSAIVNVARIHELQPWFNREYVVVLRDGKQLKLSRRYRERLDQLLGDGL